MEDKLLEKYYTSCGILKKWHDKTWDDFTNDLRAKKLVKKFVDNSSDALTDGVGPFLYGINGTGKTLLMNLAFKALIDKRHTVQIVSLPGLVSEVSAGWYDKEKKETILRTLRQTQFLGIEEIGKQTDGAKEFVTAILETVIRYRVQTKKPIWFTSNMHPSKLKEIYNEDIASMLRESCVDIEVTGGDYRKVIAESIKDKYKK